MYLNKTKTNQNKTAKQQNKTKQKNILQDCNPFSGVKIHIKEYVFVKAMLQQQQKNVSILVSKQSICLFVCLFVSLYIYNNELYIYNSLLYMWAAVA